MCFNHIDVKRRGSRGRGKKKGEDVEEVMCLSIEQSFTWSVGESSTEGGAFELEQKSSHGDVCAFMTSEQH